MATTMARRIVQDPVAAQRHPLDVIGRILFVLPFVVNGVFHVANPGRMAAAVPAWVPGAGEFWVVFSGVAMLMAGAALLYDKLVEWAGPLLAVLLLVYVAVLHLPGFLAGDAAELQGILKNVGLAGGALFLTAHRKRWPGVEETPA